MTPLPESPSPAPAAPRSRGRVWALLAVILAVAAIGVFVVLYNQEPAVKESAVEHLAPPPPRYLQPEAKTPRPVSMNPALFKDPEIRAAYQVAVDAPELLEKLPCYCGCFTTGHTSNYDCFVDRHGQT